MSPFSSISLTQIMKHREILDRLKIYITGVDVKENYLGGRLVDLSSSYVLNDTTPKVYSIDDQRIRLQKAVLPDQGIISETEDLSDDEIQFTLQPVQSRYLQYRLRSPLVRKLGEQAPIFSR